MLSKIASVINGEAKPSSSPNSGGGSHKEKTKKVGKMVPSYLKSELSLGSCMLRDL